MGFDSFSMAYTMGTALSRALDDHGEVSALVHGEWLTGVVVISDGHVLVLDGDAEHSIVKVDQIGAVRIHSPVPVRAGMENGHPDLREPIQMPGPCMTPTA